MQQIGFLVTSNNGGTTTAISGYWTNNVLNPAVSGGHTIRTYISDSCSGTNYSITVLFTLISNFNPTSSIIEPVGTNYCGTISLYGSYSKSSCCLDKTISYSLDSANWITVSTVPTTLNGLWSNVILTPAIGVSFYQVIYY